MFPASAAIRELRRRRLVEAFGNTKQGRLDFKRAKKRAGGVLFRKRANGLLVGGPVLCRRFIPLTPQRPVKGTKGMKADTGDEADDGVDELVLGGFKGWGSRFGVLDSYDEIVDPGAFKRTLSEGIDHLRSLWQHAWGMPIGVPTVAEERGDAEDGGLWWESPIVATSWGQDAWVSAKTKIVAGLSIGYYLRRYWVDTEGNEESDYWPIWHLTDVELIEVSLVTWGANPDALVEEVVSAEEASADDSKARIPANRQQIEARRFIHRITRKSEEESAPKDDDGDDAESKGESLAALLNQWIDAVAEDSEVDREVVIEDLAEDAGVDVEAVESVLSGDEACPTLETLESYAETLGGDVAELIEAAEADGCEYDTDDDQDDDEDDDDDDEEMSQDSADAVGALLAALSSPPSLIPERTDPKGL